MRKLERFWENGNGQERFVSPCPAPCALRAAGVPRDLLLFPAAPRRAAFRVAAVGVPGGARFYGAQGTGTNTRSARTTRPRAAESAEQMNSSTTPWLGWPPGDVTAEGRRKGLPAHVTEAGIYGVAAQCFCRAPRSSALCHGSHGAPSERIAPAPRSRGLGGERSRRRGSVRRSGIENLGAKCSKARGAWFTHEIAAFFAFVFVLIFLSRGRCGGVAAAVVEEPGRK